MHINKTPHTAVLKPTGELTIFEAADFHQALVELSQHSQSLEVDLSEVSECDASAVQLLLAVTRDLNIGVTGVSSTLCEKFIRMGCEDQLKEALALGPDEMPINSDPE